MQHIVCNNYDYKNSVTKLLNLLYWQSLEYSRLQTIVFYELRSNLIQINYLNLCRNLKYIQNTVQIPLFVK